MTQNDGSISTSTSTTPGPGTTAVDERPDGPDDSGEGPQCSVCPHPWSAHDRIGVRFCTATQASGATDRGCVCRP